MTGPAVDTVWLRGYPVALGLASTEHMEGWLREFRLMSFAAQAGGPPLDVPERLAALATTMNQRYAAELSEPDRLRDAAAARGDERVDLPYPVLPETEATVLAWREVLLDVDAWCRAAGLLSLARDPDLVALSDWVLDEFQRQLRGEQPRPWQPRLRTVPAGGAS